MERELVELWRVQESAYYRQDAHLGWSEYLPKALSRIAPQRGFSFNITHGDFEQKRYVSKKEIAAWFAKKQKHGGRSLAEWMQAPLGKSKLSQIMEQLLFHYGDKVTAWQHQYAKIQIDKNSKTAP